MRWLLAATLLFAPLAMLRAQETPDDVRAALDSLLSDDARLQSIGWRLARANAPFCSDAPPSIGLLLLDAGNFRDPGAIRDALGLSGDIAVDAVAAHSPAEAAGLRARDEVLAISGQSMAALTPVPAGDYARLFALHSRIEALLGSTGRIPLVIRGTDGVARDIAISGEPACRSRFELATSGKRAVAEGSRVVINRQSLAENGDDAQAATLVAHELAHNILRHRERLDAGGRSARAVQATEREADRLAPWLMANAGYDPGGAIRFAEIWLRGIDRGIFRAPTHDGWRERLALIRQEVEEIRQEQASKPHTPLDWRARFGR